MTTNPRLPLSRSAHTLGWLRAAAGGVGSIVAASLAYVLFGGLVALLVAAAR